ncbi:MULTISPECIES: hypothetical protein [Streptomyces]|uniref:Low molecular weight antigen MTB12-like C-terminal domain-containing protein n=2 Tax=Streptomyces rimosus subsp. rimosus TaxID=132474 RepID=A0A8A1UQH9_STRR1|nr:MULTISPECIES: hypothetical protein [Streptomyces]KOG68676.1 membrane protein [Kitasatospora aureofaciens]MYT44281.1 hypothetical protein [Streptomyces sp. SID5471]KEF04096.1 hypothetical protein DF17_25530 [Streptomyces rimosus]KOT35601.1 membrane protein [Streptomyces rimosus subsp. rimosus]KOT36927.1 membrane protein [Streptomyces sp. NRRL WC-3701]
MTFRGGTARRVPALVAAVLLVAAGTAGCGDADDGGQPAPSGASGSGNAGTGTATAGSPSSGSAPADPAAAEREIKENWQKFFDPNLSNAEKAKYLQNGEQLRLLLEAFNGDQRGRQVGAQVSAVRFTSATEADVTYSLTLKKATALPNAKGVSVYQDKVWKVSLKTLCALVGMSGNASAPGC